MIQFCQGSGLGLLFPGRSLHSFLSTSSVSKITSFDLALKPHEGLQTLRFWVQQEWVKFKLFDCPLLFFLTQLVLGHFL
jgi:hypothetical protein